MIPIDENNGKIYCYSIPFVVSNYVENLWLKIDDVIRRNKKRRRINAQNVLLSIADEKQRKIAFIFEGEISSKDNINLYAIERESEGNFFTPKSRFRSRKEQMLE